MSMMEITKKLNRHFFESDIDLLTEEGVMELMNLDVTERGGHIGHHADENVYIMEEDDYEKDQIR